MGRALELRIPPVAVTLLSAFVMWAVSGYSQSLRVPLPVRAGTAALLAVLGLGIIVAGGLSFRTMHTTVNPMTPDAASALVVSGVYRYTRNPMYLGMALILLGWAAFLTSALSVIVLPVFVAYLTRFQIVPEERALALEFGADYAAYRAAVRRWV